MTKTIANGLKMIKHFIGQWLLSPWNKSQENEEKIIQWLFFKITLKEAWLRAARRKAAVV
jgi:hypothetical protein